MIEDEVALEEFSNPVGRIWLLLAVVLLGTLWIGIADFRGPGSDPALVASVAGTSWDILRSEQAAVANLVDLMSRLLGGLWIGLSLMGLTIVIGGYRNGERWAWYGLWSIPVTMLLFVWVLLTTEFVPGAARPPAVYSAPAIAILFVIGLLVPVRRFFRARG